MWNYQFLGVKLSFTFINYIILLHAGPMAMAAVASFAFFPNPVPARHCSANAKLQGTLPS